MAVQTTGPTIFLVVKGGFAPRYLLRTDILPTLRDAGVRVVVLSPNSDEPYFRRELANRGVEVEPLRVDLCSDYLAGSRMQRFLHLLRSQILNGRGDLTTIRQMEAVAVAEAGPGLGQRLAMMTLRLLNRVARRSLSVRRAITGLESGLFRPSFHRDLFEKYRPGAVVVTSLGYSGSSVDPYLMREAHRYGCQVTAIVLSWDNTSSKGLRGGPVDHVIAWTDVMRTELIECHDIDADRISVCGPAHFDLYYREPALSRQQLFDLHGLDPNRKLITLATKSPTNYPWNEDLIEIIGDAIDADAFRDRCQLLVRLHPIYYRRRHQDYRFADVLRRTRALGDRYRHVHIDEPEIISTRLPLDMPHREMHKLAATLRESAVLVNIFSTLNLEGSIFDTPIVNVAFNGRGSGGTNVRQNVALDEAQPHNQRIVHSGGVQLVRTESELIAGINAYLEDPSRNREGRQRIRDQECGPFPGKAGQMIGERLARIAKS